MAKTKKLVLESIESSKKSRHALAGSNVRKELKFKFPDTKFKVTTESYSGGSSLRVSWFDGVPASKVDAILSKYEYGSFNGMEDIYEYDKNHSEEYGDVKYTFSNRSYTEAVMVEAVKTVGIDKEVAVSPYSGSAYIKDSSYNDDRELYEYLQEKEL